MLAEPTHIVAEVKSRAAPLGLEWCIETITTYKFFAHEIQIEVNGEPQGINLPNTFARTGLSFSLSSDFDTAVWFGRGPGESYRDRKLSQRFGTWNSSIENLFTDYEFPQENGNRSDVRWVTFQGTDTKKSIKVSFGAQEGCSFGASDYTSEDLDRCKHAIEIRRWKKQEPIIRLDWAHHGLGTGAIGPKTMPKYALMSSPFMYQVSLR